MAGKWTFLLCILPALLSVAVLTACGSFDETAGSKAEHDEPLEISMILPLFEDMPDTDNHFWTGFQEKTNTELDIEWVPSGDFDTKLDLVLSSGSLPDVIWAPDINNPDVINGIHNGAFWEVGQFLGDFSDYPNLRDNSAPDVWDMVRMDDEIYGIPRSRPSVDQGIKIRKDWLDELGLPVPSTLEEYADALEAIVAAKPDDTIGYVHSYGGTGIHTTFAAGFGAFDPVYDDDGGMVHINLHPGYVDTVAYFRDLYERGALPREFASMSQTQTQELFESGEAASYVRNIWRTWMFEQSIRESDSPEAEVVVLELDGPEGPAVQLEPGLYGALMLSSDMTEDKVKRILDYFEYTHTDEMFDFIFYGREGVHHEFDDEGYPHMTEAGQEELGPSVQQMLPLAYNNWWKSVDSNAPREYNEQILADTEDFSETGKVNPFSFLKSETWAETWPRFQNDYEKKVVKAIIGDISMEEFEAYINELKSMPEFKRAFQEFAEAYESFAD